MHVPVSPHLVARYKLAEQERLRESVDEVVQTVSAGVPQSSGLEVREGTRQPLVKKVIVNSTVALSTISRIT